MYPIKVSVIVPVYNVEKYLDECLGSLARQTLNEIEIIVVNDGTKDNSQIIIDQYVEKYPNKFVSLIKENGGLGDARNYGIPYAKGEYIGFIDSDDVVDHTMYEKLYQSAYENDSDLVVCDLEYFYDNSNDKLYKQGFVAVDGVSMTKSLFLSPLFAWNKLYRRTLFIESGLKYPIGLWYEDIPVSVPFFTIAKKISVVNESLVHYRQRTTSIMGSVDNPKTQDIFKIMELCTEYFERNNLFELYYYELEFLMIEQLMLNGGFRFLLSKHQAPNLSKSLTILNTKFPKWRENPYLINLPKKYQIYIKHMNVSLIQPLSFYLKLKEHFAKH